MLDRLSAVSLFYLSIQRNTQGTKTEINKFMSSQENIENITLNLNKDALSSIESRLLGYKFCCQRRQCCYTTFSSGIQNECYMS